MEIPSLSSCEAKDGIRPHRGMAWPNAVVLPLYLLLLLPLWYATILTWQEYVRLGVIILGLGYFWWRYRRRVDAGESASGDRITAAMIAVGFMFVVTQFDPSTARSADRMSAHPLNGAFFISSGLTLVAFGSFLLSRAHWGSMKLADWTVLGTLCVALGLSAASSLFFEGDFIWTGSAKLVLYGLLWFLMTRSIPSTPKVGGRLLGGMLGVFVVVCLVGGIRAGASFYHYRAGQEARKRADYDNALIHFDKAQAGGKALTLNALEDAACFGKADVFYQRGNLAKAAETLSMEEGFINTIQADAWEGPAGGMLYTNISCWKDLNLYEGEVEVRIFAWGRPSLNVWPRMRVKLGNEMLGEVDVTSAGAQPYDFLTHVKRSRQRLEISFTNDYFDPPENRDLWVGKAEVHYKKIAWR